MAQPSDLTLLVRDAFALKHADREAAANYIFRQLTPNSKLYREYREYLILKAIKALIHEEVRRLRRNCTTKTDQPTIYSYPLSSDKYLGDADRDDLTEEAEINRDHEVTNRAKKEWFELIAFAMPPGTEVKNHLSQAQLIALAEQAGVTI